MRVGAWRQQTYRIAGTPPSSLDEWAQAISDAAKGTADYVQAMVTYRNPRGDTNVRTIHGRGRAEIARALENIELGVTGVGRTDGGGSDVLGDDMSPVTSSFTIGSKVYPAGGHLKFKTVSTTAGTRHPHFKLVELTNAKTGVNDCLLAVLRTVAREYGHKERKHNATIRATLQIPAGAIVADNTTIDTLATYFHLRVRVVTSMAVPDDLNRHYVDGVTPLSPDGANRCETHASPVIIAEGGSVTDPVCDVYLADGHYQYIVKVLDPVRTCPVTGDLLVGGKELTPEQQRVRCLAQGRTWYAGTAPRLRFDDGMRPTEADQAKAEAKRWYNDKIIVYDYETTYDESGELHAYGLGYIIFDPHRERGSDFSSKAHKVVQSYHVGEDRHAVTECLLDTLARAPPDVRYTLVSFNGARFDHFLLAAAAHARGCLTSVFATSQGVRALRIGRHTTLDVAKLIPGTSLAGACKSFQTSPRKVEGFSHVDPQKAYERGELADWLATNREKVAEYLAADVLSTASLFILVTTALEEVTGCPSYGSRKAQGTVGGHAWEKMKATCPLPKAVADPELDKWIRGAIVGGRTQVFRRPGSEPGPRVIEGELSMVDFASLYPTVMAAVPKAAAAFPTAWKWGWFPSGAENGEPQEVVDYYPGDVGLYDVTIVSQPWPNVIPSRPTTPGGSLGWDDRSSFDARITHIDIELIRAGGGEVVVHKGYSWSVCREGLFRPFITPLAALKDQQDAIKAAGKTNNPALRECYKLLQNSASGKCCQANYDESTTLATGGAAQLAAENKLDQTRPITWIALGGETCLITGFKPPNKVYKKAKAKPSILAALIYSYSRALLYRVCCTAGTILYCDTDSALYHKADAMRVREMYPDLNPEGRTKTLGDLEEELPAHASGKAFLIAPKDYSVFTYDDVANAEGEIVQEMQVDAKGKWPKLRVKGVNQRSDRLIEAAHVETIAGLSTAGFTIEYNPEIPRASAGEEALERSKPLADPKVMYKFFERRAAGEKLAILSSQITRTYKDDNRPFSLQQRFMIKKL